MSLKFKKSMSMFLAAAALTTITVPATTFAAATPAPTSTATPPAIRGEVSAPVISVKAPTFSSGSFTMDPYNQLLTGEQIISSEFTFENDSTVDMEVQLTGYTCTVDTDQCPSITPALSESYESLAEDTANKILLALVAKTKDEDTLIDGDWSALEDGNETVIIKETGESELTKKLGTMARGSYATRNAADGTIKANDRKLTDGSDKLVIKFDGELSGAPSKAWEQVGISVVPTFKYIPQTIEAGETDLSGIEGQATKYDASSITATSKFSATISGMPQGVSLKTTLTKEDYNLTVAGVDTPATSPKFTIKNNGDGTATIDLAAICASTSDYSKINGAVTLKLNESAFVIADGNFKDTTGYEQVSLEWTKKQEQ